MKFFFNKKQEKCLVSHFEYFYKEKKVVFLLANSKFMRSFVPDW